MADRHVVVLLGICLAIGALAYERAEDKPFDPLDETRTPKLIIKWREYPDDAETFFESRGIRLKWLWDWDADDCDGWSVYEAEDLESANAILADIRAIIDGNELYGYGPLSDPHIDGAIKYHVEAVHGTDTPSTFPAQPAALPNECDGALPNSCPNDDGLWGLNYIRAPAVWSALPGVVNAHPSATMMVIDSGIRETHQDFVGNLVPELTVTAYTNPPTQLPNPDQPTDLTFLSHGTHVSGTVFGRWNNGKDTAVGVVGRALGGNCGCAISATNNDGPCLTNCLFYAVENKVKVINLSWGGTVANRATPGEARYQAVRNFCASGGIITIAAGNGEENAQGVFIGVNTVRPGAIYYPVGFADDLADIYPNCIINVANLQRDGMLSRSSNFGDNVRVAAPGTDIFSAVSASDTATGLNSGTSMAAPHVAGMAVLLFNAFPGATQAQVYNCIVNTATRRPATPNPETPGQRINGGIVDLQAAFKCMQDNPTCPKHGLPACVDPRSGQPVAACGTDKFCRPIPGNDRSVCQYNYRPEGTLCSLHHDNSAVSFASFGEESLEELTEAEIKGFGLQAEPSSDFLEGKEGPAVKLLGGSEPQKSNKRRSSYSKRGSKPTQVGACGRCHHHKCQAASKKWCKEAKAERKRAAAAPAGAGIL